MQRPHTFWSRAFIVMSKERAPVVGTAVLTAAGWAGEAMHGDVTPAALRAACGLIGWVPLGTGVLQLLA